MFAELKRFMHLLNDLAVNGIFVEDGEGNLRCVFESHLALVGVHARLFPIDRHWSRPFDRWQIRSVQGVVERVLNESR